MEDHFPAQSQTRARDPSVEGNEGSGTGIRIQTGSQKSWQILTAHVLQPFDYFDTFNCDYNRPTLTIQQKNFIPCWKFNNYQLIDEATRIILSIRNTIDHFITHEPGNISKYGVIHPGNSDHILIYGIRNM